MKSFREIVQRLVMRSLVAVFVAVPAFAVFHLSSAIVTGDVNLHALAQQIADLTGDGISDEVVLVSCSAVMFGTWIRIVWVIAYVVVCRARGRAIRDADRLLIRIVFRALALTPIVLTAGASQLRAESSSVSIERHEDMSLTSPIMSTHDALLVSTLVAVGVSWRLRHRRWAGLRTDSDPSTETVVHFESSVIRQGDDQDMTRVRLALRSLIAGGRRDLRWLIHHPSGTVHAECSKSGIIPPPWTRVSDDILILEASTSNAEIEQISGPAAVRYPLLLPVGSTEAGAIWLNLEGVGRFFVLGRDEEADAVWEGLCQSLALSPFDMNAHLIGSNDNGLFGRRQLVTRCDSDANTIARILHTEESPALVLVSEGLRRVIHYGRIDQSGDPNCGLVLRQGSWLLLPMRRPIRPTMCRDRDRILLNDLVGPSTPGLVCAFGSRSHVEHLPTIDTNPVVRKIMSDTAFVVRVMGRPSVDHVRHGRVSFERSRSEELVVWLALHPQRRSRSSARSEMWNVPVKDATFSNITSDVRRSLTAFEVPPGDEQWLSVTFNDELPLHRGIASDASLLETCMEHARRHPEDSGVEVLSFGLSFVRGRPLESSQYLWSDSTGITTQMAMSVVRAAMMCSEMALENGNLDTVLWSSAKGLEAVPGHEGLVAIRMRHHAVCGDRASLVTEWESYCRALVCDDWGDARPSEKMLRLWSTLSGRKD